MCLSMRAPYSNDLKDEFQRNRSWRRRLTQLYLNLEFPDDVERDEVQAIRQVIPLQRPSERSAAGFVRSRACVNEFPRGAGRYVATDLILDAGAP
jgi:hypothetical protein